MKNYLLFCLFGLIQGLQLEAGVLSPSSYDIKYNFKLPDEGGRTGFRENLGQVRDMNGKAAPYVLFTTGHNSCQVFITEKGITYLFNKAGEEKKRARLFKAKEPVQEEKEELLIKWERIDLELHGATILKTAIEKNGAGFANYNYFDQLSPNGVYGAKEYSSVLIKNIYPGIDWLLYNSGDKGFKYDFIVHAGADPGLIKMEYHSIRPLELGGEGELKLHSLYGDLVEKRPSSFYGIQKEKVQSSFTVLSSTIKKNNCKTLIGFKLSDYPKNQTLTIDPQLTWCTIFGGNSADGITSMDLDQAGNIFVTGYTPSTAFPVLDAGTFFQGTFTGQTGFVMKFTGGGTLMWSTYYGQITVPPMFQSLCTDNNGNVYVAGATQNTNFPVQNAGTWFQGANAGANDVVIVKFDNLGNRLWATYYGGSVNEFAYSVDCDAAGNLFVTGWTNSPNFPVQNAGTYFQATPNSTANSIFILKFDNLGNRLWGTYYGNDNIQAHAIRVDVFGNIFIIGAASSSFGTPNFQTLNPGGGAYFQGSFAGVNDLLILKFDNLGNRQWATYYGGSSSDIPGSLITDASGNLYVMGFTSSTNFPVQNAGTFYQGSLATGPDAFILKFNNAGVRQWATYYGGNSVETSGSYDNMDVDSCGNLYMVFESRSTNMYTVNPCDGGYFDGTLDNTPTMTGIQDFFISRFTSSGVLEWGTYFGGDGREFRSPLEVDTAGNVVLSGEFTFMVNSATYPLINPGGTTFYDGTFNGFDDCVVATFVNSQTIAVSSFSYNPFVCQGISTVSPALSPGFAMGGTFVSQPGLVITASTGVINVPLSAPGNYTINYVKPPCACTPSTQLSAGIFISPSFSVSANTGSICAGQSFTLLASGTSTSAITYSWTGAGSGSSIVVNPSGTTIYTLVGVDASSCVAQFTTSVQVVPYPSFGITGNTVLCAGQSSTLNAVGFINPGVTYSWSPVSGSSGSLVVSPLSTTVFSLSINNAGCVNTETIAVQINSLPLVLISGSQTICVGKSATLTASGASQYLWAHGPNTSSVVVSPVLTTTYSVKGVDANNCESAANYTLVISKCTGMQEIEMRGIQLILYPNPNSGEFIIQSNGTLELLLYAESGQLVRNIRVDAANAFMFQVKELAKGAYILKESGDSDWKGVKVIVE